MFKVAFIANSETHDPSDYSLTYENEEFQFQMVAVSGIEMAEEAVLRFLQEGYSLVDLCGDFNAEVAENFRQVSGNQIAISVAEYEVEELEKLETLDSLQNYGIILMGRGVEDEPVWLEKKSSEFNTTIAIVGNDDMVAGAAIEMVKSGIDFIELCSYFDQGKTEAVLKAIGRKVPVGCCRR